MSKSVDASFLLTVNTPPIMAHKLVMKCANDLRCSSISTWRKIRDGIASCGNSWVMCLSFETNLLVLNQHPMRATTKDSDDKQVRWQLKLQHSPERTNFLSGYTFVVNRGITYWCTTVQKLPSCWLLSTQCQKCHVVVSLLHAQGEQNWSDCSSWSNWSNPKPIPLKSKWGRMREPQAYRRKTTVCRLTPHWQATGMPKEFG